MLQRLQDGYEAEYGEQTFAETPFVIESRLYEVQEEPLREIPNSEALTGPFQFTSPFLPGESTEMGETEAAGPEVRALAEITAELKDSLFREALEQLADEAIETHAEQLSGEYGDRETRDASAERLLNEHFQPLAAQAEAMLDRFFERLEGYEAEALTDQEIDRIVTEVAPSIQSPSPASEQFLGGLLRKAGKLVSGAVKFIPGVGGAIALAGKGLAAIGKLALQPLLTQLKKLGGVLLRQVVKFALNKLPSNLQPIAQKLSDRLFRAIGETHEGEGEEHEQFEVRPIPAAADAAQMEAEFDLHAAQLLFTPDEAEAEYLISSYGEDAHRGDPSSSETLDRARAELNEGLARLQPGESAQPIIEHFLPAVLPALQLAAKGTIAIIGRRKVVNFIGGLLARLIRPLIGAEHAGMLAPAIADVGLRLLGLEINPLDPRAVTTEALAATIEETITSLAELPSHVFENETVLDAAVHEAFENAAASYFPDSVIRPALRETAEHNGMWVRMPHESHHKEYAKYSHTLPVTITPRVAATIPTFGSATLHDHLRDHMGIQDGRPVKTHVSLYQALPLTRGSTIARAEGFPASQLHPLTPQAASALLGPNAALGPRATPAAYLASPQKLHVGQRLYRIHPPRGRFHHHVRPVRSELLINLQRGEIRLWLYLSEPLCQHISAELAKRRTPAAFTSLKPLLRRTTEALKTVMLDTHLPPEIRIVSDTPNLDHRVPHWLRSVGVQLGAKIAEWASAQLAQYLRNNPEDFRRHCTAGHEGMTLRITMSRVPGMEILRLLSQGKMPKEVSGTTWLKGTPAFHVIGRAGYTIHRLGS